MGVFFIRASDEADCRVFLEDEADILVLQDIMVEKATAKTHPQSISEVPVFINEM